MNTAEKFPGPVIKKIQNQVTERYDKNPIGVRLINQLIHRHFLGQ